jgi:SpoVK/Ycf46/Vps4 family AAA+-type ATPase
VHKLFELHKSELSDDAMNAAAFWLALDMLEACAPHVIVIGTANSVSALPPEIQSRFHGKVITIPLPSKEHRLQALTEVIEHDESIILGDSVDVAYIMKILDRLPDSSLRDIQLLLDGAKMFRYAQGDVIHEGEIMVLEKTHFDQAVAQLRTESLVLQEGWRTKVIPALKNAALALAVVVNAGAITKMVHDGIVFLRGSNNNGTFTGSRTSVTQ